VKAMVVYDSVHGNTERIARRIAAALAQPGEEVPCFRAVDMSAQAVASVDLLVVGAPTYGGRPTPAMRSFLAQLAAGSLAGKRVAAFDTRLVAKWVGVFGFAAGRIDATLQQRGGRQAAAPEGFYVLDGKGPLRDGELERADQWARGLLPAGG